MALKQKSLKEIVCKKCSSDLEGGSIIVNGGIAYCFCKECSDILHTFPNPSNIIQVFLKPESKMSEEEKNILDARKKRASGENKWAKKNLFKKCT